MPKSNSTDGTCEGWMETAVGYADDFGWCIVPLHPDPKTSDGEKDDPVIRTLGRSPLIEIPEEASADPDEIRKWTGCSGASLAVLTGSKSNLIAIELGYAAKRALDDSELDRLRDSLPDTRCVYGPDREYYLYSLRGLDDGNLNLPRITKSNGLVLHGQNSLIRVPGPIGGAGVRAFSWSLQHSDKLAPFPKEFLSFFGIKTDVEGLISWRKQPDGAGDGSRENSSASDRVNSARGGLSFRSGEQLKQSSDEIPEGIGLSWLSEGRLSLLCGPTKTAGKSTFAVNVAAHLAAGRSFLEWELEPTPVVALSDLPASRFRSLLSRIGIDREARSRLHVVHPSDAQALSWHSLLNEAFGHAGRAGAGLVIIDSLDQFIELKSGVQPTSDVDVAHMLSTDAPPDCAVLAVKSLSSGSSVRMHDTIDRLGLLGKAADVIVSMDSGPTDAHPTLRRLQFASRLEAVPPHILCEMVRGRYQKVPQEGREMEIAPGDGDADGVAQGDGAMPEEMSVDRDSSSNGETEVPRSSSRRPPLIYKERADAPSGE